MFLFRPKSTMKRIISPDMGWILKVWRSFSTKFLMPFRRKRKLRRISRFISLTSRKKLSKRKRIVMESTLGLRIWTIFRNRSKFYKIDLTKLTRNLMRLLLSIRSWSWSLIVWERKGSFLIIYTKSWRMNFMRKERRWLIS